MANITDLPLKFGMSGDHIAIITLNRPEARNAINAELARALKRAVERVEQDDAIRVAIITGAGEHAFCAGADLKEVSAGNVDALSVEGGGFAGFVEHPRSKPWIAAVEGLALAGGFEIALACDVMIASEDGGFGLPEVTRGLLAAGGGLYQLPRALPQGIALRMILSAERISSVRAAEFGLVSELAPNGMVLQAAIALAEKIAANAPVAVRESLAIARAAKDRSETELAVLSSLGQERVKTTEDFLEGSRAFVEKRAPSWKGR